MSIDQIVNKIKYCNLNDCNLRKRACVTLGTPLTAEVNFSFYYNETDLKSAKYICIMQNPNLWNGYKGSPEFNEYLDGKADIIELHKKKLWEWLSTKNGTFLKKFLESISKNNIPISNYVSNQDLSNNNVLEDFLFTDVVKCRAKTNDITPYTHVCFKNYLEKELEYVGKGKLIFVFSSRAWNQIYDKYLKPNSDSDTKINFKITNSHGRLFYSSILESYFIPLAHFSRTQFNNYLRNSYFDYFEEGLAEYSKILQSKK